MQLQSLGKNGNQFFNVATLFYEDGMCGTEWITSNKSKAVSHSTDEIKDQLESPLEQIPTKNAQYLLKLTYVKSVAKSFEILLK